MRRHATARWTARTLFAAVVVAAALAAAAPASAHNYPVGYSPEEGAVVTEQPELFAVTTNDLLLDLDGAGSGSAMQVSGPASDPLYYGDGCVAVSGATAETEAQLGEAGEYTVTWQVVSTDGHPVSGEYLFTWQPAEGQTLAEGSATAPDCGGTVPGETGPAAEAPVGTGTPADRSLTDVAWIGGALGAVLLAVVATLLILRRKPQPPAPPVP